MITGWLRFLTVDIEIPKNQCSGYGILHSTVYRVDRVLSFFFCHPNWDSPTPSHAGKC